MTTETAFTEEASVIFPDMREVERVIAMALDEDTGGGDVTSELLVAADKTMELSCVARESLVVCGMRIAARVLTEIDGSTTPQGAPQGRLTLLPRATDGERATAGTTLFTVNGNARLLLQAERTVLNLLQHLSGIATLTRQFVDIVEGTGAIIRDTRKTTPGLRALEKYATAIGGAENHRMRMDDGILIKDNHLALFGSVRDAILKAREGIPKGLLPLEVECDTVEQAREALTAGPDIILLDNMSPPQLKDIVTLRNSIDGCDIKLEASGGITLATVRTIAETGVDYIAIGEITHSAPAVDIGMDYQD